MLRVAIAVAHGAYFGVAMVVAVGLVRPEQRGMAVALILAGLTVSGIVGVPVGTAIGNVWGWRATFWAMFVLGIVATLAMAALLPRGTGASAVPAGFRNEVRVLGRQQVWTCLIIMLMLMLGQFVPYTYIAPLLQEVTGLDAGLVPWVLLLNGLGATRGVFIGGKLAGRHADAVAHRHAGAAGCRACVIYAVSPYPLPMVAALTVWGGVNFAIGTPIQTRILAWTADAPNLASSLIPSGFNVGIAIAASVGAMMLNAGFPYRSLPLVGVASMIVAVIVAAASHAWEKRSGVTPPLPAGSPQQALASDHRQAARPPSRKRLVDPLDLGSGEPEVAGRRIVRGVLGARRLRDGEHRRPARQEGQRHLSRRRAMRIGDLLQHAAAGRGRAGKPAVAEGAVGDDGDVVLLAPGDDRMLDGALLEMIEHLVAGDLALADDVERLVEIVGVEIADAPGQDLAGLLQLLEGGEGVLQRIAAAPVQQVAVEAVGLQPRQRALAGLDRAGAGRVARQHLRYEKNLVAPPGDRLGDNFSASPYISAVSICVMPRSSPRFSAATAPALPLPPISQVPCPMTETFSS